MQAILFDRREYDVNSARAWAHKRGLHPIKYHVTPNYVRARLIEPAENGQYRTINLTKNIKAVTYTMPRQRRQQPRRRAQGGAIFSPSTINTAERLIRELIVPAALYGATAYGIYRVAKK